MEKALEQLKEHLTSLTIAIRERDANTANHCDRTSELAQAIGKHCKLPSRELDLLRLASPMHDLGKIGIPDSILLKTGQLDAAEWEVMKTHAERGYLILSAMQDEDAQTIATVVRHHHESFNRQGYPHGLVGEKIPLLSRILALADSYDAMASRRTYHEPKSHGRIMTILNEEDHGKFDPYLREKFSSFIATSPFRAPA